MAVHNPYVLEDFEAPPKDVLCSDVHEPKEFVNFVAPVVPCIVSVLNEHAYADYAWWTRDGKLVQVERKTWPEILADVDAVEDQLRRHMASQPQARLLFVLEGMVVPRFDGTYTLNQTSRGTLYNLGHKYGKRLSHIYSWLYQASNYVEVFQTPSYEATCSMLVAAFKNDQKAEEEHQTFHRYFKKVSFHPNPQVTMLMGMVPGLGEVRAQALIKEFATVWQVVSAKPDKLQAVAGIGPGLSHSILQRIGRPDV